MFHKGARTGGGDLPSEVHTAINQLLDDFTEIVAEIVTKREIRRAVVRSLLPCNLIIVCDDQHVSVAAQKASGMPSTLALNHKEKLSLQEVYEAAKWEFGFDDPFVIQFPILLLSTDRAIRHNSLEAIAQAHVQAEFNR